MGTLQKSIINPKQTEEYVLSSPQRQKYLTQCVPLHIAALKGDWDTAQELLAKDFTLITTPITEGKEIALHIAALGGHYSFVAKLLTYMEKMDLEITNANGSTAFCLVAAMGNIDIAKLMVKKNVNLPRIKGKNGISPLYMAALQGHNQMTEYLYPLSGFQSWTLEDQTTVLTTLIDSELYGLATEIVKQYRRLAVAKDCNGETPLQVLARKPLAFCRSPGPRLWFNIFKNILPHKKLKIHNVNAPCDAYAYALFGCLWDSVICQDDTEMRQNGNLSRLLFLAADSDNEEFLIELIRRYPDFLYKVNELNHSIFHIAVLRRYTKVYNLMHELDGVRDLIATYVDEDGNNILHLAAKLAPQNQLKSIPGVILQMQREILWYKEVEKLVLPSYRTKKNFAGQTPYDLFMAEHELLIKEGEKLMNQIATSCMLMTMLITIVVFTATFTVPGGHDNNIRPPILVNEKIFMVFPVSEAVATLSTLTSMLMFLSILTSRYSDDDFLSYLPFWLVIGVTSFFSSIVAMVVAFCATLLLFPHGWAVTVVLVFFASVPIMFLLSKFPLLVTVLRCTYKYRWLFQSNNRIHV